ncbi:MAG: flagellar assembly protein FliW [Ruminococcus sp.]|nr:flagellar assembly protein FliW [Ruminococcus sp.]
MGLFKYKINLNSPYFQSEVEMNILTRDFGEVEITKDDIITFDEKIYGFEEYTSFIMLYDDEFNGEYVWLQSTEEPELCFIMANPELIADYNPDFKEEAQKALGNGECEYWVMMVVNEDIKQTTVNLKSPVIINLKNHKAMQLILEASYPVKYYLFRDEKEDK